MKTVLEKLRAQAASDGNGVKLMRVFGGHQPERFDPFLMLDDFGSDSADDYIGGFPAHPHRGFETITYMLQGKMEHRDHMNNVGLLEDGGLQWMTAGRGVIHSEMPQQSQGKMHGFQLWLNLPAAKKMQAARYEDVAAANIPNYKLEGLTIKALAGRAEIDGQKIEGYFQVEDTEALYLDLHLEADKNLRLDLNPGLNTLVYVYDGQIKIAETEIHRQELARLSYENGEQKLEIQSTKDSKILLLAGRPLREPIVQYGPFVMNSIEEIEQALRDYREGQLAANAVNSGP
ncbi:pirin family protein [Agaribacterium haliotis]|uniref:pirin family protein n=1 Tax=Agaribacterium haliotis TaxID=2013869 RepID=UPI00195CB18D|nr:pirin family protein [Agaribacterium haliotis]